MMITVNEFMTADPFTLCESDSLSDARKVMTERNIRHIPVIDKDKLLLGLITQRDVLAATDPKSKQQTKSSPCQGDEDIKLSEIMMRDVSVIHDKDSLRQAAMYIQSHKYGCLPVVSNDCLIGIITDSDFIQVAINLLEQVELTDENADSGLDDTVDDGDLVEFEQSLDQ